MTPDERRGEIVKRLSAGAQGITLGALADELGVVMRTVERDLENLREQGCQIESQRGRSGGIQMVTAPSSSSNIAPAPHDHPQLSGDRSSAEAPRCLILETRSRGRVPAAAV